MKRCVPWLAIVVAAPLSARAAAWCLSTSTFGAGRLAIWEDAAVTLSGSWSGGAGRWDERGRFLAAEDYDESEGRIAASLQLRLASTLEAQLRAPWVLGSRRAGDLEERGNGAGDAGLSLRWEALPIGAIRELPGIAIVASVVAPTGRSVQESETVLGSDVTGRGAWVLSGGVSLERAHDPWFVRLDGSLLVPLPSDAGGRRLQLGRGAEVLAGGGVEALGGVVIALESRLSWEGPLSLDGVAVPDSRSFEIAAGPAASWRVTPHWTLQASAETGIFLDGAGANRTGRRSLSMGVRHAIF